MHKDGEPSVEDILRSIKKVISREDDGQTPRGIGPQVGYAPSFGGSRAFGQREAYARDADAPAPAVAAPRNDRPMTSEPTGSEDVYDLGDLTDEPLLAEREDTQAQPEGPSIALPAAFADARPEPLVPRDELVMIEQEPEQEEGPEQGPVPGGNMPDEPAQPEPAPPAASVVDEGLVAGTAAAAMRDQLAALSTLTARAARPEAAAHPLEEVVRDMLRPLLKDWLDQNLQGIVERSVQDEIARISGRR